VTAKQAGKVSTKKRVWRIAQIAFSVVLVVGIFWYAIPKLADYSSVWGVITEMTWLEIGTLIAATVFNLFSYWWQNMASLPGLRTAQAAVCNQTTTTVADTVPAGGYIALGLTYGIYRSWGFPNGAITLSILVTGVWNIFMKLGLPILALAALAVTGEATASLVTAAGIGVAILVAGVVLFALILWKESLARRIGSFFSRLANSVLGIVRKGPVDDWGEAAVRFRDNSIELVRERWAVLTLTTVVSHLALYFILLLALRHVGVSEQEVSWAQVLGVFAFGRLLTAVPLTPGGLGVIELSYIGGLIYAGRDHADVSPDVFRAQVAAAVLVFRLLTYGVQIPLGGFTYAIWRVNKSWRKDPPSDEREPDRGGVPATA
jgi:putative heme transporter